MLYGYKYQTGYIKLKTIISEKNIMQCFIADELGIALATFNKKINRNHAYFTESEKIGIEKVSG